MSARCPHLDKFCYVCGRFVSKDARKGHFSEQFRLAYTCYFIQPLFLHVDWTSHTLCTQCYQDMLDWLHKKRMKMPFGVPVIWTDPNGHDPDNCYGCLNYTEGLTVQKAKQMTYRGCASASLIAPHSDNVPVPKAPSPEVASFFGVQSDAVLSDNVDMDPLFIPDD